MAGRTGGILYWLIGGLCCLAVNGALAENTGTLQVPIYDTARPPIVVEVGGAMRGIYPDMFAEILNRADIDFVFVPTPVLRKRVLFENGTFVLACCANPSWRQRPDERKVQLFSKKFTTTRDVHVFRKDNVFEIGAYPGLREKRVGVRRGFDYRGSEAFGERVDLETEENILKAVAFGRVDVGIVNDHIFRASEYRDQLIEGPTHHNASLHIRVHRVRKDLLPRINRAIEAFVRDDADEQIVRDYYAYGM